MLKKLALALTLVAPITAAEIYQWTDANGKVHYSDEAPKNEKAREAVKVRDESNLPGITRMAPQQFRAPMYDNRAQMITQTNNDADWSICAETKRNAVRAEKVKSQRAEGLNKWLWENCRTYSNDLREIERQMM